MSRQTDRPILETIQILETLDPSGSRNADLATLWALDRAAAIAYMIIVGLPA